MYAREMQSAIRLLFRKHHKACGAVRLDLMRTLRRLHRLAKSDPLAAWSAVDRLYGQYHTDERLHPVVPLIIVISNWRPEMLTAA